MASEEAIDPYLDDGKPYANGYPHHLRVYWKQHMK